MRQGRALSVGLLGLGWHHPHLSLPPQQAAVALSKVTFPWCSPLCISGSKFPSSYRTAATALGSKGSPVDMNAITCTKTFLQVGSQSEALGVRISNDLSGGHRSTDNTHWRKTVLLHRSPAELPGTGLGDSFPGCLLPLSPRWPPRGHTPRVRSVFRLQSGSGERWVDAVAHLYLPLLQALRGVRAVIRVAEPVSHFWSLTDTPKCVFSKGDQWRQVGNTGFNCTTRSGLQETFSRQVAPAPGEVMLPA